MNCFDLNGSTAAAASVQTLYKPRDLNALLLILLTKTLGDVLAHGVALPLARLVHILVVVLVVEKVLELVQSLHLRVEVLVDALALARHLQFQSARHLALRVRLQRPLEVERLVRAKHGVERFQDFERETAEHLALGEHLVDVGAQFGARVQVDVVQLKLVLVVQTLDARGGVAVDGGEGFEVVHLGVGQQARQPEL